MASDIFFSGKSSRPPENSRSGEERRGAVSAGGTPTGRPPVTRMRNEEYPGAFRVANPGGRYTDDGFPPQRRTATGAAYNSRVRNQSAQRVYRETAVPRRAPSGFSETARPAAHTEEMITEQIDSELLHRPPTQMPYNYIVTDEDFDEFGSPTILSEKEKERKLRQTQKKAKRNVRRAKKKKKGPFRPLTVILCLLLAGALLLGGAVTYMVTGYTPQPMSPDVTADPAELLSAPTVYNLLLLGIDTQNTADSSRSDSMILLSVDNAHCKLKMTSFLRDSYVYIPGNGNDKLNAACTYGGPQLVRDTIEYNFGIKIDGCVKIGYDVLTDLVDGIGGITIPEVDAVEAAALAAEGYDAPIGTNIRMNGFQALTYCRIRKGQNDFYRTERQREVLGIIFKKVMRTNPLRLARLGRQLLAKAECSVPRQDLFALFFRLLPCLIGGAVSERVPQDGTWYDDTENYQDVLKVSFEENHAFLKEYIYGK